MNHVTSIGLDVHARSITAVALDSITGEVRSQKFKHSPAEVASWILQFESPKAVYESGVTGFHLVRTLREFGVDCIVGAVSKCSGPLRTSAGRTTATMLNFWHDSSWPII